MEAAGGGARVACPSCHTPLVIDAGYVTWCSACEWNVEPGREAHAEKPRDVRRRQRALQRSQRVFDEVASQGTGEGAVDPWRIASYALSALVLLIGPALLALAVVIAVESGGEVGVLVGAGFVALLAVTVRPRFGRLPRRTTPVSRADAPATYALVDRIATAMGARSPRWIQVKGDYNASHGHIGLRRRGLLTIGAGLWAMLDDRQRIAVLGHEIAHDVNGDLAHGVVVGGALGTLHEVRLLFLPSRVMRLRGGVGLAEGVAELVGRGVAAAVGLVQRGLVLLRLRNGQRAEYRADLLAAGVAGTEATAQMLDALMLTRSCAFAVDRARRRDDRVDAWAVVRAHLLAMPPREHERARRVATRRGSSVDDSHPPTPLRVAMVRNGPSLPARVGMDATESAAIEAELRAALLRNERSGR